MRGRTRSALLLLTSIGCAIASGAVAQDQDEPCPSQGFTPQLMTPAAGYLPRDSAFVVGLFPGGSDTSGTLPAGMALTRRRRSIALRSETIAPGLFRLVPETQRIYGRYEVSGIAGSPQLYFRRAPLPAPPTRPALERVERYRVAGADGERLEVRAHFAFPLPQGTVALVSYWGEDDEPDAFARAAPTQRSLVLFTSRGRCDAHPEGTNAPPETGGSVRVAFVDQHGQVSQLSEAQPIE